MPFANDNAGTIKQRVNQYQQITHSNANVPLDDVSLSKSTTADNTPTNLSSATSPCASHNTDIKDTSQSEHSSVSVLNDIGNMLANLTDELDAMLSMEKEEKRNAGHNDSE